MILARSVPRLFKLLHLTSEGLPRLLIWQAGILHAL
jgi:hypothetical protein